LQPQDKDEEREGKPRNNAQHKDGHVSERRSFGEALERKNELNSGKHCNLIEMSRRPAKSM
jgi:hypothetical protein